MAKKEIFSYDIVIALGIIVGFLLPQLSSYLYPYVVYPIIFTMFLNFVKLDFKEKFSIKIIFLWLITNLGFLPMVAYLLSSLVQENEFKIGLILITLAPAAVMSPVYAALIGGKRLEATAISVISHLASIIAVPLLLFLYTGSIVNISYSELLRNIAYIILLPFIIALIVRRYKTLRANLSKHYDLAIKLVLFILLYIIIGENSRNLLDINVLSIIAVVLVLTIIIFMSAFILKIFIKLTRAETNTLIICSGIKNGALIIGIIASSFSSKVAIPVALYIVFHQIINTLLVRLYNKGVI